MINSFYLFYKPLFLFDYLSVDDAGGAGCIRFIGIYVHRGIKLFTDPHDNVAEYKASSISIHSYADHLLVLYTKLLCLRRRKVYMTFCGDDALGNHDGRCCRR